MAPHGEEEKRREIARIEADVASLDARDATLADQIERLQVARQKVSEIYEDDESFVSWVDRYDAGGWRGSRREEFEGRKRDAKGAGDSYCDQVRDIYCLTGQRLGELENERAGIWWQRGVASSRASSLRASIAHLEARW